MLPLVEYVLIHWTTDSYQTVRVLIRTEHFMSTTKHDSTRAIFILVALIQTASLFANFLVTGSVIFQVVHFPAFRFGPSFSALIFRHCAFLVRHCQVLQIQRLCSANTQCTQQSTSPLLLIIIIRKSVGGVKGPDLYIAPLTGKPAAV